MLAIKSQHWKVDWIMVTGMTLNFCLMKNCPTFSYVPSSRGSTERAVVTNSYRRVVESLPLEEYQGYYVEVPLRGKRSCLGYLTHYENINMNCDKTYSLSALSALKAILDPGTFARDFRSKQETGSLDDMQGPSRFSQTRDLRLPTKSREGSVAKLPTTTLHLMANPVSDY
ncbi:PREDICTED: uncharacterized protein LOC107328226 isoform X6 [Acropora digitifera]|uniref:uncharacterized protein LOC107328226 isoform X6 n=1 Tax=Acropora digitifera TaxID=70779 RepID=UPI00077A1891|nr:PREDICTED: uncharacterized protein LOC107328226 isoform X6 [Acropora digitifera]